MMKTALFSSLISVISCCCLAQNQDNDKYLTDLYRFYNASVTHFRSNQDTLGLATLDSINGYLHDLKVPYDDVNFMTEVNNLYQNSISLLDSLGERSPAYYFYEVRGTFYGGLQNYKMAILDLSRSIDRNSESWVILYNRGIFYRKWNMLDEALLDYNAALEISRNNSDILNNRGYLYIEMKKYKEAKNDFYLVIETANDIKTLAFAYNNLAYVCYLQKQYDAASDFIEMSISLYSNNPYVYRNKGLIELKTKNKKSACESFEKAKSLGFAAVYGDEIDQLILKHCE